MKTLATVCVLTAALAAVSGCAAKATESEDGLGATESEQKARRNCSFIPGCTDLREASDGPVVASVMTYNDRTGKVRRRLSVTYKEAPGSSFLLCRLFPRQPAASVVFVLGEESSVTRSMQVDCPTSYGDNGGATNSARFSTIEDEDPELWDTLFPPGPDGKRWLALQIALSNAHGEWDSRYGQNYRLVID